MENVEYRNAIEFTKMILAHHDHRFNSSKANNLTIISNMEKQPLFCQLKNLIATNWIHALAVEIMYKLGNILG